MGSSKVDDHNARIQTELKAARGHKSFNERTSQEQHKIHCLIRDCPKH